MGRGARPFDVRGAPIDASPPRRIVVCVLVVALGGCRSDVLDRGACTTRAECTAEEECVAGACVPSLRALDLAPPAVDLADRAPAPDLAPGCPVGEKRCPA